ncbi:methyl-accepting chemotaxis protein [Cellulomonas chengniuliangii]|uniref:Methyl-accepting chemotaxis protein n=1 Tax=Cellulomonas chengniuliangii TaxID=2968084 RepID=A0ABY5KZ71_9CELL|nr:methyl-accepting chemotaxis protein [Cellulomonas chengniuliangii]MCC2309712.1 methyl-accepting chemotaxis protein [Cellulomonas chengniuliangii]UUI74741.1 methyl-accepting chemotaxis protein [Cellulomonas chengniuliangii]
MSRLLALAIRTRLMLLVGLATLGLVSVAVIAGVQLEGDLLAERQVTNRAAVQTAMGIVESYGERAASGEMTTAEAQAAAIESVKSLRYSGEEYFWINDMQPAMIMHPTKPELDGTDLNDYADPDGTLLFVEFVKVVKAEGSGFVAYQWPRPGEDAPQPKISFVTGYEPWGWVVGSGVYIDDVRAAAIAGARDLLLASAAIIALVIGLSVAISRSIVKPIEEAGVALASGDLATRLDPRRGTTELDKLALALNATLDRTATVSEQVGLAAEEVGAAARRLVDASDDIGRVADDSARLTVEVASAAHEVSEGIDTVASGTHEMGASIGEIARTTHSVAQIASEAVDLAQRTDRTVSELGESSAEIGSVVKLISAIAEQTNLLALNATIEAARAGEAGKGFAVVAGEVKELAQETARATGDISSRVEAIQAAVTRAAGEIGQISSIIGRIDDYQGSLAGAVEEQTATTAEMAKAVAEVADGGRGIATTLAEVERATHRTTEEVEGIRGSARDLVATSQRLEQAVLVLRG